MLIPHPTKKNHKTLPTLNYSEHLCKVKYIVEPRITKDMALPIASIPVLTGEVAQRFEERAQANYQRYLNRTEEQKKTDEAILEKKLAELYSILSKAHLGRR